MQYKFPAGPRSCFSDLAGQFQSVMLGKRAIGGESLRVEDERTKELTRQTIDNYLKVVYNPLEKEREKGRSTLSYRSACVSNSFLLTSML